MAAIVGLRNGIYEASFLRDEALRILSGGDGLDGEVVRLASATLEAFDADEGTGGFAGWVHAETIGRLRLAGGGIYYGDDSHLETRTGRTAGLEGYCRTGEAGFALSGCA